MVGNNVYGGVFIARFDYIREKHGVKGLDLLKKRMRDQGYTGPLEMAGFKIAKAYPFSYYTALLDGCMEVFGEAEFANMSRLVAMRKGIVGWFVKWADDPGKIMEQAGHYWSKFYDFGRMEGEVTGDGQAIIRLFDVPSNPTFCMTLTNYFEGVMANTNANDVSVEHVKCISKSGDKEEWIVKWS